MSYTDLVIYPGQAGHSITITDYSVSPAVTYNTWTSWGLIPSSRPIINPPSITSHKFVEIPGMDGSLDLSEYIAGSRPVFSDRSGNIEFYIRNRSDQALMNLKSTLTYLLPSKIWKVKLEDDPNFEYEGRLTLSSWKPDPQWSKLTIDYRLDPYKYSTTTHTTATFTVSNGSATIPNTGGTNLPSDSYAIKPTVTLTSNGSNDKVSVVFGGVMKTVSHSSRTKTLGYSAAGNSNLAQITGTGTVQFTYREAAL